MQWCVHSRGLRATAPSRSAECASGGLEGYAVRVTRSNQGSNLLRIATTWRPYGDSNPGYCRERAVS